MLHVLFERFSERTRQVVVLAQEEARALTHNYIGTKHILLGLMREEEGLAARALKSLDITIERVRAEVVRLFPPERSAHNETDPVHVRRHRPRRAARARKRLSFGECRTGLDPEHRQRDNRQPKRQPEAPVRQQRAKTPRSTEKHPNRPFLSPRAPPAAAITPRTYLTQTT